MHRKFFEAAWLHWKAVEQRETVLFTSSESIADFMKIQEIFFAGCPWGIRHPFIYKAKFFFLCLGQVRDGREPKHP